MKSDLLPVLEYMEHEKGIARADMIALIAEAVSSARGNRSENGRIEGVGAI